MEHKNHLNCQLTWSINCLVSLVTPGIENVPHKVFLANRKILFALRGTYIHIVMQCQRVVEFLSMEHSRDLIMINKKLIHGHVSRFIKKVRPLWIVIQYKAQNQTLNNRLNGSYTWWLMISHMHACMLQYRNSGYRQRISHILKYR